MTTIRGSEDGNRYSPTGYEILTRSGQMIDLTAPRPEQIRLGDIAHALSEQRRFAGHCPLCPTIAEHSVVVERIAAALMPDMLGEPPERRATDLAVRRAALMHDAAEYLVGDVTGAVKLLMRPKLYGLGRSAEYTRAGSMFDRLEDFAQAAIETRFGCAVPDEFHGLIHEADCLACAYEMAWGGWCADAKPPSWVRNDPYIRRCYGTHDGGHGAFMARADRLGMSA